MNWLATHWDRVTPASCLLFPLSVVFRAVVALRRCAYAVGLARSQKLPVPVIVVGNITAGGTGKTPVVLWLARYLKGQGYVPGIVSRGYGGTRTAAGRVAPDADPLVTGDEPVLLARLSGCEVWTGADRAAAARALLAAQPACDVLLSDDGLQHYGLGRDVEICVVDGARGMGNGWLLPAGPLREPPSRLSRVDAIVVNGGLAQAADLDAELKTLARSQRFRMSLDGHEFHNLRNRNHRAGADHFLGLRLHAVAGIGNPQRFFQHLRELGLDFVAHAFPDHHRFRPADLAHEGAEAVLMTEKDAVKCEAFAADTHWVLPVDPRIDKSFGELVIGKLKGARVG